MKHIRFNLFLGLMWGTLAIAYMYVPNTYVTPGEAVILSILFLRYHEVDRKKV